MAAVLVVVPSPKSQNRLVIVPVELSVKVTIKGLTPLVGLPTNAATGTLAPVPRTLFVLLPPFAELNSTTLLKLIEFVGVKRMRTLVDPKPGTENEVADMIVNGLAVETV